MATTKTQNAPKIDPVITAKLFITELLSGMQTDPKVTTDTVSAAIAEKYPKGLPKGVAGMALTTHVGLINKGARLKWGVPKPVTAWGLRTVAGGALTVPVARAYTKGIAAAAKALTPAMVSKG